MVSLIMAILLAWTPFGQEAKRPMFEVRARQNLLMGKGQTTSVEYWDVIITRQPTAGVLLKLPYTRKGGRFSFDLHHRVALTEDFGAPAEITTVVEVLSGGTNSLGVYTISDRVSASDKFEEAISKVSTAEIDRYVTPLSRKTITMDIRPGPQSISIVGQTLIISRDSVTTRVDTPGTRIATISNFKFEEVTETNPLKKTTPGN